MSGIIRSSRIRLGARPSCDRRSARHAVTGRDRFVSGVGQRVDEALAQLDIVVDDEEPRAALHERPRQLDAERGAAARFALHGDSAVAGVDNLLADPQAEAEAGMPLDRGRPFEAMEDPLLLLRQDSFSGVPYLHARAVLVGVELDLDGTAAAELDRVGEQVGDHLADADPIPVADHSGRRRSSTGEPACVADSRIRSIASITSACRSTCSGCSSSRPSMSRETSSS